MKVALAQINPTVGALDNNSQKITEIIRQYSDKCDIIIFPEMVLTGYPPQDLLLDDRFIRAGGLEPSNGRSFCFDLICLNMLLPEVVL